VPHLLIVGLVTADIMLYPVPALNTLAGQAAFAGGYSVLNLLVVIAGFFLLVTGAYPAGLFSFLMGINRWCYRVLAYLTFLTDEYPPFRLDAGAVEPGVPDAAAAVVARGAEAVRS
jgi:NAD/NADP transhydrogenase beta subunit